jgi:hypothetical protein
MRGPRPDPRNLGQRSLDLLIGHVRKRLVAQPAVDEPFRERPQGGALAGGHAARAKLLRVQREQLLRRRQMAAEPLLQPRDDRPSRAD